VPVPRLRGHQGRVERGISKAIGDTVRIADPEAGIAPEHRLDVDRAPIGTRLHTKRAIDEGKGVRSHLVHLLTQKKHWARERDRQSIPPQEAALGDD